MAQAQATELKLNPNVKLWLKALRSNKYHQITGLLREGKKNYYSYCALGVAMKIAQDHDVRFPQRFWKYSFLPSAVVDWLGLEEGNNDATLNSVSVLNLNDNYESFRKIADEIEAHPEAFGSPRYKVIKSKAKAKAKAKESAKKSKKAKK